jgi:hypothetical protein
MLNRQGAGRTSGGVAAGRTLRACHMYMQMSGGRNQQRWGNDAAAASKFDVKLPWSDTSASTGS